MNNKNFRFDTSEGEGFIPGLVESVVGMTTGEEKTFELVFPAAWYIPSMQGVTGKFTATLKELFAYEFAPLDDELAPQLMDGCVCLTVSLAMSLSHTHPHVRGFHQFFTVLAKGGDGSIEFRDVVLERRWNHRQFRAQRLSIGLQNVPPFAISSKPHASRYTAHCASN